MSTRSSRVSLIAVILLGVVVLLLAGSSGSAVNAATNGCKKVDGAVALQQVACPSPLPPNAGCGEGTIKGGIKGTFEVIPTGFVVPEQGAPGIVFTTANTVFTTSSGTLWSKDAATLSMISGEYAEVITIMDGSESYAGATGMLTAVGAWNLSDMTGSGTYSGQLCLP